MNATESQADVQAVIEKEIGEREPVLAALQKKLQSALAQITRRKEEIAKAADEVNGCRSAYQDECRKFAGGQKAAVCAAKTALDEAADRAEGLRLLLADEEGAAATLQQESVSVEDRLKELCHLRQVEIDRAEIAALGELVQQSLDTFRKLAREGDERLRAQVLRWAGEDNNRRADRLRDSIHEMLRYIGNIDSVYRTPSV